MIINYLLAEGRHRVDFRLSAAACNEHSTSRPKTGSRSCVRNVWSSTSVNPYTCTCAKGTGHITHQG